jgi:hypothetical protein
MRSSSAAVLKGTMKGTWLVVLGFLLLNAPAAVQAQPNGGEFYSAPFYYDINADNTITITGYWSYSIYALTIPATINGLAVTTIGDYAFFYSEAATALKSITIANGVTSIGVEAFDNCESLTSVTIPGSVTSIGDYAFYYCPPLDNVYFDGNAPTVGSDVFGYDYNATIYYLPGTTGWSSPFAGLPAVETVPEPNSLALLGLGLSALAFLRRASARKSATVLR